MQIWIQVHWKLPNILNIITDLEGYAALAEVCTARLFTVYITVSVYLGQGMGLES